MKIEIYLRGRYEPLVYEFPEEAKEALNKDFLNYLDHGFPRGGIYSVADLQGAPQSISLHFEAVACIVSPALHSSEDAFPGEAAREADPRLAGILDPPR